MDQITRDAFERLLKIARSDTGQAGRAANFILAWWNASDLGGFDLSDLFSVDNEIASDMARVFSHLASRSDCVYPSEYRAEIEAVIRMWRPEVWSRAQTAPPH